MAGVVKETCATPLSNVDEFSDGIKLLTHAFFSAIATGDHTMVFLLLGFFCILVGVLTNRTEVRDKVFNAGLAIVYLSALLIFLKLFSAKDLNFAVLASLTFLAASYFCYMWYFEAQRKLTLTVNTSSLSLELLREYVSNFSGNPSASALTKKELRDVMKQGVASMRSAVDECANRKRTLSPNRMERAPAAAEPPVERGGVGRRLGGGREAA